MTEPDRNAELLLLASGAVDRTSVNGFDARLEAVRALFPHLATTVEVVEGMEPTTDGIRIGHQILDLALFEPVSIDA